MKKNIIHKNKLFDNVPINISTHMSKIKSKKNKYEKKLAKALWHRGYRYRLNYSHLPGTPDITLVKWHIAIFVDGEFWHGKDFKARQKHIHSHEEYWKHKIQTNIIRDKKNDKKLIEMGWIPLHFWTMDINKNLDSCIQIIEEFISYQIDGM